MKKDKNKKKSKHKDKKISIVEEAISIDKITEETAEVVINKDVEITEEILDIPVQKDEVVIEHIPMGQVIEKYPSIREEEGKTIIPVVKEKLVVTKQLFLEEEIHITRKTTDSIKTISETLRKDVVNIERKKY